MSCARSAKGYSSERSDNTLTFFHGSFVVRRTMIYSYRSATIGSTRIARRAGK
jgi:hypothetical protein